MKRRKKKVKIHFFRIIIFFVFIYFIVMFLKTLFRTKYVSSVELKDNKIIFTLKDNDLMCMLSSNKKDDNWIESDNKTCSFDKVQISNLYLKKDDKVIDATKNEVFFKAHNNETIYLAVDESYFLFDYVIGDPSNISVDIDKNIIKYKDGYITALKEGETNITIYDKDEDIKSKVIVTSIINKMDIVVKEKLKCEKYSKEEATLLDNILKSRIENAGYKTRAGVVEAARFLSLSFPYKIEYFYENGRQTTNKVDGEGRYYHIGLYLDESKFDDLTGSTTTANKGIWGCSIHSYPINKKSNNGLDCSGFVSWALLNGGFDVKDVGAGWSDDEDLTDYGEVLKLDSKKETYSKLRVGDLLHSERLGGHIGIIVGEDNKYFYVAQAIWYNESGLVVSKIQKDDLYDEFPHGILMDEYYKEDGNLTNMWN